MAENLTRKQKCRLYEKTVYEEILRQAKQGYVIVSAREVSIETGIDLNEVQLAIRRLKESTNPLLRNDTIDGRNVTVLNDPKYDAIKILDEQHKEVEEWVIQQQKAYAKK